MSASSAAAPPRPRLRGNIRVLGRGAAATRSPRKRPWPRRRRDPVSAETSASSAAAPPRPGLRGNIRVLGRGGAATPSPRKYPRPRRRRDSSRWIPASPRARSQVPVNIEYVSERFGLLVIICCGESLFAAVAILSNSFSIEKLCLATLAVYFALLIKLLYFELQGHVAEHAMAISRATGVWWTLAHIPVFVCTAGAGAVLHWAASSHEWVAKERNLFLGFTFVLLLSLSLIMLLHGRLHNDRKHWYPPPRRTSNSAPTELFPRLVSAGLSAS